MRSTAFISAITAALLGFSMASPAIMHPRFDENHGITVLVCDAPANLATCKRDCDCPGDSLQPDCGHPVCHDNCRCRGKFRV